MIRIEFSHPAGQPWRLIVRSADLWLSDEGKSTLLVDAVKSGQALRYVEAAEGLTALSRLIATSRNSGAPESVAAFSETFCGMTISGGAGMPVDLRWDSRPELDPITTASDPVDAFVFASEAVRLVSSGHIPQPPDDGLTIPKVPVKETGPVPGGWI